MVNDMMDSQNGHTSHEVTPLWIPDSSNTKDLIITRFIRVIEAKHGVSFGMDYSKLHRWTCDHYVKFWDEFWNFSHIVHSSPYDQVVGDDRPMNEIPKWFVGSKLNYAENLLAKGRPEDVALYVAGERTESIERITFSMLRRQVYLYAAKLRYLGVKSTDRVAGYMPNNAESVYAMLATSAIGATWSSASPDFGVMGVLDRLLQVKPKIIFSVEAVFYNSKVHDHLHKLMEVAKNLPTVEHVIVCPFVTPVEKIDISVVPNGMLLSKFLDDSHSSENSSPLRPTANGYHLNGVANGDCAKEFHFEQVPFDHPLFIMFSSGTTGAPKCMVHSVGGTLLKHLCEHMLQTDMSPSDILMFYTTTGWMMWNWLISAIGTGGAVVLYDGSPILPQPAVLFDLVDRIGITMLGAGAKCYAIMEDRKINPKTTHNLSTLRCCLSTGSPLKPQSFEFLYGKVKDDLLIGSISGGTDIIACFMGASWLLPVYMGECQAPYLGCDIQCWDETGNNLFDQRGELVCTKPFPSMPVSFLNDPKTERYKKAYFDKFKGIWAHGDYCIISKQTGGIVMLGRSDGTLNPGGVRFGSAEIYNVVESFPDVADSLCVGQPLSKTSFDERVVLFLKMKAEIEFSEQLVTKIKSRIRQQLSARHVPALILAVADIPYTTSGKKVEIAVKRILAGEDVTNRGALANPESLECYVGIPQLKL